MKLRVFISATYTYPEKKLRESKDPENLKREVFENTFKALNNLKFLKLKSMGEIGVIFESKNGYGTATIKRDPFAAAINYIPSHNKENSEEQDAIWKILLANGFDI